MTNADETTSVSPVRSRPVSRKRCRSSAGEQGPRTRVCCFITFRRHDTTDTQPARRMLEGLHDPNMPSLKNPCRRDHLRPFRCTRMNVKKDSKFLSLVLRHQPPQSRRHERGGRGLHGYRCRHGRQYSLAAIASTTAVRQRLRPPTRSLTRTAASRPSL